MADIELVIKIPEEYYKAIKAIPEKQSTTDMLIIRNGTPLPKGHGRLIDADALEGHRQIQIISNGNGKYIEVTTYYQNDIDIAPTIVEADDAESEGA